MNDIRNDPGLRSPRRKAPPAQKLPVIATKARDLEALKKAVEDAAGVSGTLWISYIFVLLYIAIASAAVTHVDLLLERPVKLPFLQGIELPLKGFFALAPVLFVIMHAYTLAHFVLLADKVRRFHDELHKQLEGAGEIRDALRRQLPSNIFVQFLAGPKNIRVTGPGWLLKAIAWTTLVFAPILLLLLLQIQFLPYHQLWITWLQRTALFADFFLLLWLWPRILQSRDALAGWRRWTSAAKSVTLIALGVGAVASSLLVMTFPGEWQEAFLSHFLEKERVVTAGATMQFSGADKKTPSLHDRMFKLEIDWTRRSAISPFPNSIVLPGFNIFDQLKIGEPNKLERAESWSLRGRDLKGAVFDYADLRKVDFEGADLENARFTFTQLQDSSFLGADLSGALAAFAHLQGANFAGSKLRGASFDRSNLRGAHLDGVEGQGASFVGAQLQGASLDNAGMQGASFAMAELQGSDATAANFQGVSFDHADLRGVSMKAVKMQGAVLDEAKLSGAKLFLAQLQGASFRKAALQRAHITAPNLWRARFEPASIDGSIIWKAEFLGSECLECDSLGAPETQRVSAPEAYKHLRQKIEQDVPTGPIGVASVVGKSLLGLYGKEALIGGAAGRDAALKRIEVIDPGQPFPFEADVPGWKKAIDRHELENARNTAQTFQTLIDARLDELRAVVCSNEEGAIYALLGEAQNSKYRDDFEEHGGILKEIGELGESAPSFAESILNPECPISIELADRDKTRILAVAREAAEKARRKKVKDSGSQPNSSKRN